jgi:hypothetical protein
MKTFQEKIWVKFHLKFKKHRLLVKEAFEGEMIFFHLNYVRSLHFSNIFSL